MAGHCPRCLFRVTFDESTESPAGEENAAWTGFSGLDLYEEIGRGGMGVVYRARQTALNRVVAVKVLLRARFASPDERGRFHREAQAAARLHHPAIVGIFDVGETEGVPWFSMEHVAGESLEQRVREHPMESREAARLLREIAAALQHAHEHGVLHRDLKPSNILLDGGNFPHVSDFGIARIATGGTSGHELTRTGQMLGSPGYAAPEQAFDGSADARTDVYGLGALLYHLLTGRPPFQGPTLDAILVQLRENDPLPPRRLNPSVPRDLETICLQCLRKPPERRYQDAAAVADDLDRFLDGKPIRARPLGLLENAWRWTTRHPAMASMLAVIALLVTGLTVGSLAFARHQARIEHRASLVSEARTLRQSRLAGGREAALAMLREAWSIAPSAEIRHEAAACLALPGIGPISRVAASPPDLTRSADGRLAAAFSGNDIVIRETATGRETARLPRRKPGSLVRLDDQGRRIAIAEPASGLLQVVSLTDQRVLATCAHPMQLHDLAWGGDLIATSCDNRFIYLWDDQGQLKHRLSGHESPFIRLAFRPGGQELASTAADSHVRLWHAARGTEILRLATAHEAHTALWWSADGATLFGATGDGQAEAFSMHHSACLELLTPPQDEPHSENLGSADFSADGRCAVVIDEQSARLWDFAQGRLVHQFPKPAGQWLSARFSPDGRELLLCGWADDLTTRPLHPNHGAIATLGAPTTLLRGHGNLLRDATSDGKRFVLSNNSTGHFLVVSRDRSPPLRIRHPGTLATTISPDGSWLVTTSYQETGAKVWSMPESKLIHTLCGRETVMQTCALGNTRLIARTTGSVRVFRTSDWTEDTPAPGHLRFNGMTASRDGRLLATLGDNDIRILETAGFTERLRLTPPSHAGWLGECHLVFDADASHLLVHTALGCVMRWNLLQLEQQLNDLGLIR
jgi:WD40 repeat protein/predicted Ser/Thr protein kinase